MAYRTISIWKILRNGENKPKNALLVHPLSDEQHTMPDCKIRGTIHVHVMLTKLKRYILSFISDMHYISNVFRISFDRETCTYWVALGRRELHNIQDTCGSLIGCWNFGKQDNIQLKIDVTFDRVFVQEQQKEEFAFSNIHFHTMGANGGEIKMRLINLIYFPTNSKFLNRSNPE